MKKNVLKVLASIAATALFVTLAFGSEDDEKSNQKTSSSSEGVQSEEKTETEIDGSEFIIGDDTTLYSNAVEEEEPTFII